MSIRIRASCGWNLPSSPNHCAIRSCRGLGIQLSSRFEQITVADDVVALEHGPRFVPCELHRDALGHASSNHIANGCSSPKPRPLVKIYFADVIALRRPRIADA
jgi:hypothetical protein